MYRRPLLVAVLVLGFAPAAFAQEVIAPYDAPPAPAPPAAVPAPPPVPPPVVVPPPGYHPPPSPYAQPGYAQPGYAQPGYAQPTYLAPPAPRFHEVVEPRYGLVIAGAVILGASWSTNAAVAYAADEWKLAVPVVGPFLETQNIDTSSGHEANRSLVMLLAFDGLVETAGAVMILAGALTHHRVRRYDSVSIVPAAGRGSVGLAAFGSF